STTHAPARRQSSFLAGEMAFCAELLGRLMPRASIALAIVFAVYIPPQEPGPGMAQVSTSCRPASEIFPAACWPMASKTETTSTGLLPALVRQPGRIVPP